MRRPRRGIRGHRLGQAEVEDLRPHVARRNAGGIRGGLQDDVGRLQIAMDDPFLVRGLERLGDLTGDGERLGDRQRSSTQAIGQRRSLDQFEDQRRDAVRFFETVDRADVRVIERGEEPRFAREAGAALGIDR